MNEKRKYIYEYHMKNGRVSTVNFSDPDQFEMWVNSVPDEIVEVIRKQNYIKVVANEINC